MDKSFQPISVNDATNESDVVGTASQPNSVPKPEVPDWLSDPRLKQLDPRFVVIERITGGIVLAVIAVVALVAFIAVAIATWPPRWWLGLAGLAGLTALSGLAWLAHFWPAISHRHCRYMANDEGLEIYRGVLWRSVIKVPRARIQHSDVRQGPLQRRFDLGKLVVHTAGTQHAAIELDGLRRKEALALRDLLTSQARGEKENRIHDTGKT